MNFANLRGWEWVIILIIVLLLFGVGRISKIAGELGNSIRAFREGLKDPEKEKEKQKAKAEAEAKAKQEAESAEADDKKAEE